MTSIHQNNNVSTSFGRGQSPAPTPRWVAPTPIVRRVLVVLGLVVLWLPIAAQKSADELYVEAVRYEIAQDYGNAIPCMERAAVACRAEGDVAGEIKCFFEIGSMHYFLQNYSSGKQAYQTAYALACELGNDSIMMRVLTQAVKLIYTSGDAKEKSRIDALIDSIGTCSLDDNVRYTYNRHKGHEASEFARYDIAELWYKKNEALLERHPEYRLDAHAVQVYTDLRDVYTNLHRYDEALRYAYLDKDASTFEESATEYYLPYVMIAYIYSLMGDSAHFETAMDTAFISVGRISEPRAVARYYTMKGLCYKFLKNYAGALATYKACDSLLATKYPLADPNRMELHALMAYMEMVTGDYDAAVTHYSIYKEDASRRLGMGSDAYIHAHFNYANALAYAGRIAEGSAEYEAVIGDIKSAIRHRLAYYTVAEREAFWEKVSPLVYNMSNFALRAGDAAVATFPRSSYDALVMTKSFLLESERSVYDMLKRYGSSSDLEMFTLMQAKNARIKDLERDYSSNADSILALTAELDSLGKVLSSRCRTYGDITSFMDVGFDDIRSCLGDDEVVIDFADYVSETLGRCYAAYVIRHDDELPTLKLLFTESKIDSMGVQREDLYYEQPYSSEFIRLLWEPLSEYVPEGSKVYYVPTQLLFNIAPESLQLEDGSLLGDHYRFVRLSSAREVTRRDVGNELIAAAPSSAVLYGGLQYDVEPAYMAMEAGKYNVEPLLAMRGGIARGDSVFHELPGTKLEAEAIESILRSTDMDVMLYTAASGTEESFLNMDGHAPTILHIATHGFYYDAADAQQVNFLKGADDAMQLSGLVMSGGNAAWLGRELPDGVLGGILTANNISRVDLSGVEMVVLSACQSGQGKATSEGLFGLQRAFKKAGVKTMVMTLWGVDDFATREFMVKFYELMDFAVAGWDKRKAFEGAKAFIRSRYHEAYYWAAFVMLD